MQEIDLCVVGGRICAEEEEEQEGSILTVRYLAQKGDFLDEILRAGRGVGGWGLGLFLFPYSALKKNIVTKIRIISVAMLVHVLI